MLDYDCLPFFPAAPFCFLLLPLPFLLFFLPQTFFCLQILAPIPLIPSGDAPIASTRLKSSSFAGTYALDRFTPTDKAQVNTRPRWMDR